MADGAFSDLSIYPALQRGFEWVEGVLSGEIPANELTVLACRRHQNWIEAQRSAEFPYYFDVPAAAHALAFIERMPHVEGALAAKNETIRLDGWQCFAVMSICGWLSTETGLRLIRTAFVEVPRKCGKTTLLAALGLYFLTVDGERGAKVFSAATTTHQAKICFEIAKSMVHAVPELREPSGCGLTAYQHKIVTPDPAAIFQPISSQTKSKDGKNPHLAIIDEVHELEDRSVWDSMASSLGARAQPLLIGITTAGYNTAGVCYEQHEYLKRILEGILRNDRYFGLIFCADEGDEPGDPATWRKANPSLGTAKSEEYLADEWRKAEASDAALGEFLRKHLCIWTSVGAAAFKVADIEACMHADLNAEDFKGAGGVLGVDLSIMEDLTALVVVIPKDDKFYIFSRYFAPIHVVNQPARDHYFGWAQKNLIETCPTHRLDLDMVADATVEMVEHFGIHRIDYDPIYSTGMMDRVVKRISIDTNPLSQGYAARSEPFSNAMALTADRRFVMGYDPIMRWAMANTSIQRCKNMVIPSKLSLSEKIDPVDALVNALYSVDVTPKAPTVPGLELLQWD